MITEINGKQLDFHQLWENSVTAKIITKDGEILYANEACLKLLALSDSHLLLNHDYFKFLDPSFHTLVKERFNKVLEKKATEPIEIKLIKDNGDPVECESSLGVFYLEGEPMIQITLQDISERKESQKRLMQTEKLAVIGELATGIVHEIRNPITIIKGFLYLLNDETSIKGQEYLQTVSKEIERVEVLANDLLMLSKPREQKFQSSNLIELIQHVQLLLETFAFKKKVVLTFDYPDDTLHLNCDEGYLKQALINLIKNAIEATPKGGEVTIKIEVSQKNVTLLISDTGCGMTKEQLHNIGHSFYSTKQDGTGLGLMIAYNIIKNHRGTIQIISKIGKGTTFRLEFPQT